MTVAGVTGDSPGVGTTDNPRQGWIVASCLLAYVLFAVAIFWPVSPWNATHLTTVPFGRFEPGDPVGMTWSLAWTAHALTHELNVFHTTFLDYPGGAPVTNGATLLGVLAAPVTLTLGPVAAFNVLLRLAFASSAASMFLVLRSWCRWPAAFVGGVIYGFGPYVVTQGYTHLNLMFVPIPPLIVWCVYDLLVAKRHRPARVGALLGVLAAAQALIEQELLTLMGVVIAIGLVGYAIAHRHDVRARFNNFARGIVPAVIVFAVLTGYMLWSLLFGPGHLTGTISPIASLQAYRTDLLGPIVPTFSQLLMPSSLATAATHFLAGNATENSTYLGIPAVVLLGVFGVRYRRVPIIAYSALLAAVAFIFSLGSRLSVYGHVTNIPLPEALFTHLPLLDNTVPSRFSFIVCLFSTFALAVGADHYLAAVSARSTDRRSGALFNALGIASLVACVALLLPQVPIKTVRPPWPTNINAALKGVPSGALVLSYPYPVEQYSEAMAWQASDNMKFRLFGGYIIVPGKRDFGIAHQALLPRPFVQEYFAMAQFGLPEVYPAPIAKLSARKELCNFLSHYGVGAVIFLNQGVHPREVKRLLLADLGAPLHRKSNGNVLVWRTDARSCVS
jgi:hypothetical protein